MRQEFDSPFCLVAELFYKWIFLWQPYDKGGFSQAIFPHPISTPLSVGIKLVCICIRANALLPLWGAYFRNILQHFFFDKAPNYMGSKRIMHIPQIAFINRTKRGCMSFVFCVVYFMQGISSTARKIHNWYCLFKELWK